MKDITMNLQEFGIVPVKIEDFKSNLNFTKSVGGFVDTRRGKFGFEFIVDNSDNFKKNIKNFENSMIRDLRELCQK